MTRILLSTILLSLFPGPLLFAQSNPSGTIEITFHNIRSPDGQMAIGINHRNPDNFPRKADIELQFEKEGMKDGSLTVQVKDQPYGMYAISVLDDENLDLEIELFMGIPREGFGFSTNPPFKLRAPRFEECSFEVKQPLTKISIELRYAGKGR
jgi:uncharacterized protein (DUF2141 family)